MMPSTLSKRNAIMLLTVGIVSASVACGERLALNVVLKTPTSPDPFAGITLIRVTADLDRGAQGLGEVRWDQGPVTLPVVSNPAVQRIVVEGLDSSGRVVASGASLPLDLLRAPPDDPISIDFTRIGVLSAWDDPGTGRRGARTVQVAADRWMVVGGLDSEGCAVPGTELFGPGRADIQAGPVLPGGRGGDFSALALSGGEVLVVGGTPVDGCTPTTPVVPWRLDPRGGPVVEGPALDWPAGIAVAALSESLVLAAGGWGPVTARTEVFGLDPRTFATRLLGSLSIPRARGTLVALGSQRALMLGGQTQTSTASALLDASVFEPSRGATLDERIGLGAPTVDGAAVRTAAGSVAALFPDPVAGRSEVKSVVVKSERDIPLGDVTPITVVSATATASLLLLADGSLLHLSADAVEWIQLLPRQSVRVPVASPLYGGVIGDGNVLLFDTEGRMFTFNPGPASVLGWRGPAGALQAVEGRNLGLGLVPRRPAGWRLTRDGLEGEQPAEGVELGEWVVAIDREWDDFDLTVELFAEPGGRGLVLWGADRDRFTFVEVGPGVRVGRFGETRSLPCPTPIGPGDTDQAWSTVLRVRRERQTVTIEWSDEPELVCTFDGQQGWLGLGVSQGKVTFRRVRVGLP